MEKDIFNDLKMILTPGDLALYGKVKDGVVLGITGSYVDDSLNDENEVFITLDNATRKKLESKDEIFDSFDSCVAQVNNFPDGTFKISQ